jgi:HEAT repeat protein
MVRIIERLRGAGNAPAQPFKTDKNVCPTKERCMKWMMAAGWVVVIGMITAGTGCGGQGAKPDLATGRGLPPPKLPPAYPPSKDVPIDEGLRAKADAELARALGDANPNVRAHALEATAAVAGKEHARQIEALLSDKDPLVRYAACLAVGDLKLKEAEPKLLGMIDDPDAGVRVVVRYALHRIGYYKYSHDLEEMAKDPQANVRGTAAMVLGMIGDPSALNVLRPMRHDFSAPVRQQVAVSMWRLGSDQGMKDLIGLTVSPYQDDKKVVILGLAQPRNRNVIQHIRINLTDDAPEVCLVAARAMGMLGCDEGYGVATRGARSEDPRQRVLAALALGAIGRSDSQEVLRELLADANADVRVAAAEGVLELKPHFVDECSR